MDLLISVTSVCAFPFNLARNFTIFILNGNEKTPNHSRGVIWGSHLYS